MTRNERMLLVNVARTLANVIEDQPKNGSGRNQADILREQADRVTADEAAAQKAFEDRIELVSGGTKNHG